MAKKGRVYPQCGTPARLGCIERNISEQIEKARSCDQLKKLERRANYLITVAHRHKVSWSITEAKSAKARLFHKVCVRQDQICPKPTKACKV